MALLNATVAAIAIVADKNMHSGTRNLAIAASAMAASRFIVGIASHAWSKEKQNPGPGT